MIFFLSCKNETDAPCICTKEYVPVCAGGKYYSNVCLARCDGYKDDEIILINLTSEEVEGNISLEGYCSN